MGGSRRRDVLDSEHLRARHRAAGARADAAGRVRALARRDRRAPRVGVGRHDADAAAVGPRGGPLRGADRDDRRSDGERGVHRRRGVRRELRRAARAARARGSRRRERELVERPRGHALVRRARARARARRTADGDPDRRLRRRARAAADRRRREAPRPRSSSSQRSASAARSSAGSCCASAKHEEELEVASLLSTLRDRKLWRLSLGSGLYLYAQLAVLGFAVVFLHDEHGLSESRAALAVAGVAGARDRRCASGSVAGRTSSARAIGPLLRVGVAISVVARRDRRARERARLAARPRDRARRRSLDGVERTVVHDRRRARRPRAQRRRDRPPADRARRRRDRLAGDLRRASCRRRRGTPRSSSLPPYRSSACGPCCRCGGARLRACGSSSASTSSTRSAAARGRTARTPPRRRTRRIGSRRRGSRRRGSRSRSTATATSSDAPPRSGRRQTRVWVRARISTRFRRAVASTVRSVSSRRSRPSSASAAGSVVVFRGEEVGCIGSRALVAAGGPLPTAFLELHVEQGPMLADRDAPLGVVTGDRRATRAASSCFEGTRRACGHDADGGPRRCARRGRGRDPARSATRRARIEDAVATVGRARRRARAGERDPVRVPDSASTSARPTPGGSTRSSRRSASSPATASSRRSSAGAAPRRYATQSQRAGSRSSSFRRAPATTPGILAAAGVDAAMLFVRSLNGGVSHSPDELSSDEDVALAVDVLADALAATTR